MTENINKKEHLKEQSEKRSDSRTEFGDLVELGAYRSLAQNEFFQKLEPGEQIDAMHNALANSLSNRNQRFMRLVVTQPELAAQYRDQEIKPVRNALRALDQIAVESDKNIDFSAAIQQDELIISEELEQEA